MVFVEAIIILGIVLLLDYIYLMVGIWMGADIRSWEFNLGMMLFGAVIAFILSKMLKQYGKGEIDRMIGKVANWRK